MTNEYDDDEVGILELLCLWNFKKLRKAVSSSSNCKSIVVVSSSRNTYTPSCKDYEKVICSKIDSINNL